MTQVNIIAETLKELESQLAVIQVALNKFLLDMAGQALGKIGLIDDAIYFLEKST